MICHSIVQNWTKDILIFEIILLLLNRLKKRENPEDIILVWRVLNPFVAGWEQLNLQELKLIQVIDKLRTKAAKLNRVDRITKTMVRMGKSKIWEMSNGNIVHVQTTNTARALDLMNVNLNPHPQSHFCHVSHFYFLCGPCRKGVNHRCCYNFFALAVQE